MSDDRLLTWLVLGAIGVTLFSTFMTMFMISDGGVTGKVTDTGTATTTLAGSAGVSLTDSAIAFGSGYYDASCTSGKATLDSFIPDKTCWTNTTEYLTSPDYHTIRNSGTTLLNVTADTDKTSGEALFCGSDGGCLATNFFTMVRYKTQDTTGESGSCNSGLVSSWTNILVGDGEPSSTADVCDNLNFEDENDEVNVYYEFTVPMDATSGEKTLTVTYTGTAL
jgi:hypothetical protein